MTEEERGHSQLLVYQILPSRYGMNPDHLRKADAIEIVIGQGAKPGGGGMLLGQKISPRVAQMRTLPEGIDQRSACRHPDWTGPDDLEIKIGELREITDWQKPIYVKVGAARPYYDIALAVKSGADVVVLDGMQGGTAATQEVFIEHIGIPILAAIRPAVRALQELGMHRKVQLIVSGGIRTGADVAKALALGADAVSIGTAALIALGDNSPAPGGRVPASSARRPAATTIGTRAATRPASRRRTRSSRRASIRSRPAGGSPTISPCWRSRRRRSRGPAARATCTISSPRTWSPSRWKRPRWRGCRSRARTGYPAGMAASGPRKRISLRGMRRIFPGWQRNEKGSVGMTTDLAKVAAERGIKYFLISFVDLFGTMRAKLVPAAAIDDMAKSGAGFAGFASWLDMTPADPDMFAVPDPDSLIQLPWKKEVGWLAAAPYMNGKPVEQAPRNVLKAVIEEGGAKGLRAEDGRRVRVLPRSRPTERAISDPGDHQAKPCYDQQALMRRYDVITEICDCMLELGWGPYQNDHEDANGQFEMNWQYDSALKTADKHAFFKYMVKSIAEKHGLRATFMPKPFTNLTGNGCHAHVSMWSTSNGQNLFEDANGPLGVSALGYQFLGGILHSAEGLAAITNPTVNSYKRINAPRTLSGATWSPNTVTYAGNNRTHMIRIPDPGRFELRLADGATNPYMLPAAILVAGLDGIENKRDPGPRLDIDMYTQGHTVKDAKRLPLNLLDALRALQVSSVLKAGLGQPFVQAYIKLKTADWNDYAGHLTEWERRTTLDC